MLTPTQRVAEWIRLRAAGRKYEADQLVLDIPHEDRMAFANLCVFWSRVAPVLGWFIAIEAMMLAQLTSHFFAQLYSRDEQAFQASLGQPRAMEIGEDMATRFRRLDALREMCHRAGRILGLSAAELVQASGYGSPYGTAELNILDLCEGSDLNREVLATIERARGVEFKRKAGAEELAYFESIIEV